MEVIFTIQLRKVKSPSILTFDDLLPNVLFLWKISLSMAIIIIKIQGRKK